MASFGIGVAIAVVIAVIVLVAVGVSILFVVSIWPNALQRRPKSVDDSAGTTHAPRESGTLKR